MDPDRRWCRLAFVAAAVLVSTGFSISTAQAGLGLAGAEPVDTLAPGGLGTDARFGTAVDVGANALVVGAPGDGSGDAGKVYVYRRALDGGWSFPETIDAPSGADSFGASVAVQGSTVVVGAPLSDAGANQAGAVYAFIPGAIGWVQQDKLTLPAKEAGADLGRSVAIAGDTIVAGAPLEDRGNVNNAGAAYVSEPSGAGWTPLVPLPMPPPESNAEFGHSVDVDGINLLVGAPRENTAGTDAGAAYAYVGSGTIWAMNPLAITPSDGQAGDRFGRPVAVQGTTAVVGARDADVAGESEAGAAYVFAGQGAWVEEARLEADDPQKEASFGHAVAVDGTAVLVGAPHYDDESFDPARSSAGRAHLFARSPLGLWELVDTLSPSEAELWDEIENTSASQPNSFDRFGQSVALSPIDGVVGAPFDEVDDTGSARAYRIP